MFKENIIMLWFCFRLSVLPFSHLQLHKVANMEKKVNNGSFSTLFLIRCFQWQTGSSCVLFLKSLEMPFLWVWLAGTADPILAEGIRSGGCSARGHLWILGPGVGLGSQLCTCLSPPGCLGLGTSHPTHGYKAQKCRGAPQAGGEAWGTQYGDQPSCPSCRPSGAKYEPSWGLWQFGSLPVQQGWIRLQWGRRWPATLRQLNISVIMRGGASAGWSTPARNLQCSWPCLHISPRFIDMSASPLSSEPAVLLLCWAFIPLLFLLLQTRFLWVGCSSWTDEVQLLLRSAEFTNASYLIHLLFSLRYWHIFFYLFPSHGKGNEVNLVLQRLGHRLWVGR